jgi:hypothetical protein
MESKLSIDSRALRHVSDAEALSFADEVLGGASAWSPSLVAYRLSSDFQRDWKIEVGSWLLRARDLGFLQKLKNRLTRAANESYKPSVVGPNDSAHVILNQELAPAMVAYYFTAIGWSFKTWEPATIGGDVDVCLETPTGLVVDVQVKASDQPGYVEHGRIVDGEYDERVLSGIDKAAGQLKSSPGPGRMIVVSPQRTFSVGADVLARQLLGEPSIRTPDIWGITRQGGGRFAGSAFQGVSALADLSLVRGPGETLYRCTVICNPWVLSPSAHIPPSSFPHARIFASRDGKFVWEPEEPARCLRFFSGVPLLD